MIYVNEHIEVTDKPIIIKEKDLQTLYTYENNRNKETLDKNHT